MSKHVREKCGKLCISNILSSKRGITPTKFDANWRHSNLIYGTVEQSHMQNFSIICQSMKEKSVENCVFFSILSSKRAISPTNIKQIDGTRTWSIVRWNKVICKIWARYVQACRRKVRNTAHYLYSKFTKRHISFKNWRKVTTVEFDL